MSDIDWRALTETWIRFAQGWDNPEFSAESAWRTQADVTFEDRGEVRLKGVADPQRAYAVGPR